MVYPNNDVATFIREHFIPAKFQVGDRPDLAERYNVHWTPTLIILDGNGKEHHRSTGYLPPDEYQAMLALALGKAAYNRLQYDEAARWFDLVRERFPRTAAAPEALYWSGVAQYKGRDDRNALIGAWKSLGERYPQSEWAQKVSFIHDS